MSIDSADIDNDLVPEIYIGQVTGTIPGQRELMDELPLGQHCNELEDEEWQIRCRQRSLTLTSTLQAKRKKDVSLCLDIRDPSERSDCVSLVYMLKQVTHTNRSPDCTRIPDRWEQIRYICEVGIGPALKMPVKDKIFSIKQIKGKNVLLVPAGDRKFKNRAGKNGVGLGGWTWNAKFADLDNDEWTDLYVANGFVPSDKRESNIFYRNQGSGVFSDETTKAGLVNHEPIGSYVYTDMDNDGDLDVIVVPFDAPIVVYKNHSAKNNSIVIELRDHIGNRFGVGSRVIIRYGNDGQQMRELKASGGYNAFDPIEAHFGLGNHESVQQVEIYWSTGEQSVIEGPFPAGKTYRITRSE